MFSTEQASSPIQAAEFVNDSIDFFSPSSQL